MISITPATVRYKLGIIIQERVLILKDKRQELPTMGVSDSGQHSSKPCQAHTSQRGNEEAGVVCREATLQQTWPWPWYTLGMIQWISTWTLCSWVQDHLRPLVLFPKIFSCITGNLLHCCLFFYQTSCLLKCLAFKLYLSLLSFSGHRVSNQHLWRASSINELNY